MAIEVVEAVKAVAQQAATATDKPAMPTQTEIDEFTRAMMNRGLAEPERAVVDAAGKVDEGARQRIKEAASAVSNITDPREMLAVQRSLASMAVDMEVAAKVAGSISQSVNKLVTMQ